MSLLERTTVPDTAVPAATRAGRPGWRDPRIVVGVVIVALSVLLGVRLVAAADDTVGVWALAEDLPTGASVTAADLERREVRFADAAAADRYVAASDGVPAGSTLRHAVGSGELLPRSALSTGSTRTLVEVPLSVGVDDVPATVRQGSVVDVYVAPKTPTSQTPGSAEDRAVRVLQDVAVVSVPGRAGSLAPETTRQVIVGVDAEQADGLGQALGSIGAGRVLIVRQQG